GAVPRRDPALALAVRSVRSWPSPSFPILREASRPGQAFQQARGFLEPGCRPVLGGRSGLQIEVVGLVSRNDPAAQARLSTVELPRRDGRPLPLPRGSQAVPPARARRGD